MLNRSTQRAQNAASQRTAYQVLTKVMNAPSRGVQVSCVAPISLECTAATANIDGLGTWDQGSAALEGYNPGGVSVERDASQLDPGQGVPPKCA